MRETTVPAGDCSGTAQIWGGRWGVIEALACEILPNKGNSWAFRFRSARQASDDQKGQALGGDTGHLGDHERPASARLKAQQPRQYSPRRAGSDPVWAPCGSLRLAAGQRGWETPEPQATAGAQDERKPG